MSRRTEKRPFIYVSSSSEEEEEDDGDGDSDGEEDDDDGAEDYGDDEGEEDSDQTSRSDEEDDSIDQGSSDNEYEDENNKGLDNESLSDSVLRLLREGNDLRLLTLQKCKAYLRQHGLRISGTKAECLQRIKVHWRIKDGNSSEAIYPRSSFVINCTGDVCKGDVVLFKQKVYNRFGKVKRSGRLLGKRTIAGRVVKESYGAARQQHTFTVEVLWSRGIKRLPPLFPLLVKGRNLYRMKTFRQHWKDESERPGVLSEKHKRGAAARLVRERKKMKRTRPANEGMKCQRHCSHARPSQTRAPQKRAKRAEGCGKASSIGRANSKLITNSRSVDTSRWHPEHGHRPPACQSVTRHPLPPPAIPHPLDVWHPHTSIQRRSSTLCYPGHEWGSNSTASQGPSSRPYADPLAIPASPYHGLHRGTYTWQPSPNYRRGPALSNRYYTPGATDIQNPVHPYRRGRHC